MRRDFGLQEEGSESENEPTSPMPLTPPAPEGPNPPLESLRETTPLPSSPGSPTLNLTPVPSPQPQPSALLKAPTLDLTPSPLPEDPDCKKQEEEGDTEEDWADQEEKSSDIKEEVKSKEAEAKKLAKEKLVEETEQKQAVLSIQEAIREEFKRREEGPVSLRWPTVPKANFREKKREFVHGLKSWRDLKPRKVQALVSHEGCSSEGTKLSFKHGEVMTAVRPAAWVRDRWLEGTLDGRVGLIHGEDVKYLD